MDRAEAVQLAERVKRQARQSDVISLCEYVLGLGTPRDQNPVVKDVPKARRGVELPTQGAASPVPCPVCAERRKRVAAAVRRYRGKIHKRP